MSLAKSNITRLEKSKCTGSAQVEAATQTNGAERSRVIGVE